MSGPKLIVDRDPKSPVSEAYRVLRTNIQFSDLDNPVKTIVVTSAGPGEGKTTSVINLGVAMARSGFKVLLIDGNLRKPQIHKVFETFNRLGLTDVLVKELDYRQGVSSIFIDGLEILPAGTIPPNPSELLISNRMRQFLNEISEDYDFVIIDTPPAAIVTDASILSAMADGTILVCASGGISIDSAKRARKLLKNVNANIIGVILNKFPIGQKNYAQYYHYAYHEKEHKQKRTKRGHRTRGKFA